MARIYLETNRGILDLTISEEEARFIVTHLWSKSSKPEEGDIKQILKSTEKSIRSRGEMPSSKDVYKYLSQLPQHKHTLKKVSKHFLGREVTAKANRKEFEKLWTRIKRAKARIAKEKEGKWKFRMKGREKESYFKEM